MAIFAHDLPPEIRNQVLTQLREQLGNSEFSRLVTALGEDGLLDLYIQETLKQPQATAPREVNPDKIGISPWWLLAFGAFLLVVAHYYCWRTQGQVFPEGGGKGILEWQYFDWSWWWKITIGLVSIAVDWLVLCRIAAILNADTKTTPSSPQDPPDPLGCFWSVLEFIGNLLAGFWMVILFGIGGFVGGPILLVWGVIDLAR